MLTEFSQHAQETLHHSCLHGSPLFAFVPEGLVLFHKSFIAVSVDNNCSLIFIYGACNYGREAWEKCSFSHYAVEPTETLFVTFAHTLSEQWNIRFSHLTWCFGPIYYFTYSVALVRKRTIPTERPPLAGEVGANFCRWKVPRGQRDRSLWPYCRFSRPNLLCKAYR
jgi:hypothetical protein